MAQFNRFIANFSKVLIIHWLTWIKFFDLNIQYVFDKRHTIINDFPRQFRNFLNDIDEIHEENINNFINE